MKYDNIQIAVKVKGFANIDDGDSFQNTLEDLFDATLAEPDLFSNEIREITKKAWEKSESDLEAVLKNVIQKKPALFTPKVCKILLSDKDTDYVQALDRLNIAENGLKAGSEKKEEQKVKTIKKLTGLDEKFGNVAQLFRKKVETVTQDGSLAKQSLKKEESTISKVVTSQAKIIQPPQNDALLNAQSLIPIKTEGTLQQSPVEQLRQILEDNKYDTPDEKRALNNKIAELLNKVEPDKIAAVLKEVRQTVSTHHREKIFNNEINSLLHSEEGKKSHSSEQKTMEQMKPYKDDMNGTLPKDEEKKTELKAKGVDYEQFDKALHDSQLFKSPSPKFTGEGLGFQSIKGGGQFSIAKEDGDIIMRASSEPKEKAEENKNALIKGLEVALRLNPNMEVEVKTKAAYDLALKANIPDSQIKVPPGKENEWKPVNVPKNIHLKVSEQLEEENTNSLKR